jgi:2-(1,2-epoxy-1,2-dihydrophenyl)acetyl-CoA isomerase
VSRYEHLRFELAGDVAAITIARPERLNALASQTLDEIAQALDQAVAEGARAVLLTGEGRAFSAGADLIGPDGQVCVEPDLGRPLLDHYNPLVRKLADLPIPVVAAVRGAAAGAGSSLALHADFVIAGKSAYFLLAFVNIGLVPDAGGIWLIAKTLGRARALEMAMLGERLYAEQAAAEGLIYRVVEDDQVLAEAQALARRLAKGPTLALGMIRKAVNAALGGTLDETLDAEVGDQRAAGFSEDAQEGVAAFVGKRPAVFKGR